MNTGEENNQLVIPSSVVESTNSEGNEDQKGQTDRVQDEELSRLAEESRTIAQQTVWMEKQTFWLRLQAISAFGLGVLTLLVLIFHGWMMWEQAVSNRQAAAAANDQLRAMWRQNRPWVSVKVVPYGPLEFREERASLPIEFTVTNVGNSTATTVYTFAGLIVGVEDDAIKRQNQFCEISNRNGQDMPLMPSNTRTSRMNAIEMGPMIPSKGVPSIFLVGCVGYTFGGQTIYRHTGFVFQVMTGDPQSGSPFLRPIRIGENLPPERIRLMPEPGGDFSN